MGEGAEFGRVEESQEEKAVVVRGKGAEDSGGDAVSFLSSSSSTATSSFISCSVFVSSISLHKR